MEREFEEERQQLEKEKKHSDKKVRRVDRVSCRVVYAFNAPHVLVLSELRGSDRAGGRRAKDLAVAQEARARLARTR